MSGFRVSGSPGNSPRPSAPIQGRRSQDGQTSPPVTPTSVPSRGSGEIQLRSSPRASLEISQDRDSVQASRNRADSLPQILRRNNAPPDESLFQPIVGDRLVELIERQVRRQNPENVISRVESQSRDPVTRPLLNRLLMASGMMRVPEDACVESVKPPGVEGCFIKKAQVFEGDPSRGATQDIREVERGTRCQIRRTNNPNICEVLVNNKRGYAFSGVLSEFPLENRVESLTRRLAARLNLSDPVGERTRISHRRVSGAIFPQAPRPQDIRQGGIGDCYFLAVLGSIAKRRPQDLLNMIKDNGDGTVTVRFYRRTEDENGKKVLKPHYILMDKSLIHDAVASTQPRNRSKENWPALLEKAYMLHRCEPNNAFAAYSSIGTGFAPDAIEHVLGEQAVSSPLAPSYLTDPAPNSRPLITHLNDVFSEGVLQIQVNIDPTKLRAMRNINKPDYPSSAVVAALEDIGGSRFMLRDLHSELDRRLPNHPDLIGQCGNIQVRFPSQEHIAMKAYGNLVGKKIQELAKREPHLLNQDSIQEIFDSAKPALNVNEVQQLEQKKLLDPRKIELVIPFLNKPFETRDELKQALLDARIHTDPQTSGSVVDSSHTEANQELRLDEQEIEEILNTLPEPPSRDMQRRIIASCQGRFEGAPGSGQYSIHQREQYEKIEGLLAQEDRIVCAGTLDPFPIVSEGRGLNNESVYKGLASKHTYMVLGVVELRPGQEGYPFDDPNGPPLKFIKLRNPWGDGGDNSGRVYDVVNGQLEPRGDKNAEFLLELTDFTRMFKNIYHN